MEDLNEYLVMVVGPDESVEATLRECGAHVVRTTCPSSALEAMQAYQFDLLVLDLEDPEEGRMVRESSVATDIPSVEGKFVDCHLRSPGSLPIVLQMLLDVLNPQAVLVDHARIRQYSGGDPEFESRLAQEFLRAADRALGGLEEGTNCGDLALVHKEAHSLKGLCYMLGAYTVGRLCESLEGLGSRVTPPEARLLVAQLRRSIEENRRFLETSILKVA